MNVKMDIIKMVVIIFVNNVNNIVLNVHRIMFVQNVIVVIIEYYKEHNAYVKIIIIKLEVIYNVYNVNPHV